MQHRDSTDQCNQLLKAVALQFNVSLKDILSRRPAQKAKRAHAIAAFLMHKHSMLPRNEIGVLLGCGYQKANGHINWVADRQKRNKDIAKDIQDIEALLRLEPEQEESREEITSESFEFSVRTAGNKKLTIAVRVE